MLETTGKGKLGEREELKKGEWKGGKAVCP